MEKIRTNASFSKVICIPPLFNMISPISYTQTPKDHRFNIYVFVLEGVQSRALKVRYFSGGGSLNVLIVAFSWGGDTIHIMQGSISNGPCIGSGANLSSL